MIPLGECDFAERDPDGHWLCIRCWRPSRHATPDPPGRLCILGIVEVGAAECKMTAILSHLIPAGVDRLQRCRVADCGLMLPVDGQVRCVGMPGSKCQWLGEWAARLNGEKEFPSGGSECPHWL